MDIRVLQAKILYYYNELDEELKPAFAEYFNIERHKVGTIISERPITYQTYIYQQLEEDVVSISFGDLLIDIDLVTSKISINTNEIINGKSIDYDKLISLLRRKGFI